MSRSTRVLATVSALVVVTLVAVGWLSRSGRENRADLEAADSPGTAQALELAGWDGPKDQRDRRVLAIEELLPGTVVVTVDERGRPLPGVQVFSKQNDRHLLLGATGDSGRLDAAPLEDVPAFLVARKDGYRTTAARVAARSAEVTVTLVRGASIAGHVVRCDGVVPAGGEVEVIAWPAHVLEPPLEDVRQRAPALARTAAEEGGSFQIDGLDGGTGYRLIAAERGWMSRAVELRPGERATVLLELEPIHAVRVELVEAEGPLRLDPSTLSRSGELRVDPRVARHVSVPWFVSEIVGLSARDYRYSLAARTHAFAAPCELGDQLLGPLEFSASIPSYRTVDTLLFARPLRDGVATHTIELETEVPERGNLEIEILGLPRDLPPGYSRLTGAALLTLVDDRGGELPFLLDDASRPRHRIEGIPFGCYDVAVSTRPVRSSSAGAAPARACIGPVPERVTVDLRGTLGSLELSLEGADATTSYAGPATVVLILGEEASERGSGGSVFFRSAPYSIQLLPPGRYVLRLLHPPVADGASGAGVGPGLREVQVQAGETTRVVWTVVDRPLETALSLR